MRIQVTRTGGFAGIELHREIDTDETGTGTGTAEDTTEWRALAERAVAEAYPSPRRGVPDGFGYEITVDGHTVHCAEPDLTDAQRELISRVLRTGA
ncbi:protealysin inhibitor emfourin [Streptomyces sp. NPDC000594]|uniref:protealysin inhibitor emfourin n=1 Tax=Streptomyces sp. NPDC000594 TaxID=3154261 RepID=UPI00332B5037